ncbi:MAG: 2Fe-2S iron-sulfur cluster binding domain-containing protein, partial [Anaerolineales bacterium]|nr:2Fe-2S iron-sulfur cluster binding domain-containing protein [Anaerolineales bacterium]
MTEQMLSFTVNGEQVSLPLIPNETLADLLRERLNLTGTKIACNEDECGSCTVLIDGEAVLSCTYPSARVQGKEVLTIEGLANPGNNGHLLHPLQAAFMEYGAVQCGFCIPGQIMTAYALLQKDPNPSPEAIRHALKDTLCRCGSYPSIERSVQAAAQAIQQDGTLPPPNTPLSKEPLRVVGQAQVRPDAQAKVTGSAIFTDDLHFDGMLHAAVKRAGVPHGTLKSLDVSKARQLEGVVCVLTAEDIPGEQNHGLFTLDWPALVGVGEQVRYVGDAVAIIAAETRQIAQRAAA